MDKRLWTAVLVADALIAAGGTLLLVALNRVFESVFTLAPQPPASGEALMVIGGLMLVVLAPLASARITGASIAMGVAAALGGLVAVWLAILFDPQDGSLMPLAFGVAVSAAVAFDGLDKRSLPRRGLAAVAIATVTVVLPAGWLQVATVLLAYPAIGLTEQIARS